VELIPSELSTLQVRMRISDLELGTHIKNDIE